MIGEHRLRKAKEFLLILRGDDPRLEEDCRLHFGFKPLNKILIGTHHKAGFVWLRSLFLKISNVHKLFFYEGPQSGLPMEYDIFFEGHSRFNFDTLDNNFKGIHLIRDPRDVIVSGCFFHQKSSEEWLHRTRYDLQGLSYQQKLNSFTNFDDQLLFEMENVGDDTVKEMLNWDYSSPLFLELKYEDLIIDGDLHLFHKIYSFLGFPGPIIPSVLAISYNKSLFSGQIKHSLHVRSGETNQWKKYFKLEHKKRFLSLFDDTLIKLGYEKNDDWAN